MWCFPNFQDQGSVSRASMPDWVPFLARLKMPAPALYVAVTAVVIRSLDRALYENHLVGRIFMLRCDTRSRRGHDC